MRARVREEWPKHILQAIATMATFNEIHGLLPTLRECRKRSCSPIDVDTQLPPSKRLRFAPDEDSRADMSDRICLDNGSVDARKWFEDSNNDASATDNANFIGGDSPFYLEEGPPTRRASAFAASPISDRGALQGRRSHRPKHADLNRTGSSGSNSEDYRSVIDDLTIENKLLRRKLKKYERLHCSQLESEKLFEVRVHGLPPQKKRDLERALRQIAAGLEDSPEPPSVEKGNGSAPQKTSAPNTASKPGNHYPTPVDSAYASTTSDMSNPVSRQMEPSPEQNVPCADSKQENVLAYMQDIPESLAPSRPSELSDKAKSKIIVKRLEQLFDGKSAAYRQSEFSRQQQDISTSATLVENRAREARGHRATPEGAREARILPRGSTIPLESTAGRGSHTPDEGSTASSDLNRPSNEDIPDQRPTRPMDLDVHHTQAGFKHMEYIRHLQPTSPVRQSCASNLEEGWVYLNLLSSMAQLHTFNVTPEFVRQAIKDFSSKLQLSSDGHQVKWRGIAVSPAQRTDAESSSAGCDSGSAVDCTDLNNSAGGGVRNYVSTLHKGLSSSNTNPTVTNFEYKPLFCHELQSDDDLYLCDSEEGVATEPVADATGVSNSFCASQVPNNTLASAGWTNEGGPIIFYNKACFFTDLSGTQASSDEANYYRYTQQPLGLCVNPGDMNIDEIDQFTKRPSLKNASSADSFSSREGALNFPDMETLSVQPGEADIAPVAFEASGLGGIQPEDNFVVDVEMRHSPRTRVSHRLSPFSHPRANIRKVHHTIPSRSILAFRESDSGTISKACSTETQGQIISTTTRALPPSALPPASYVCLPFSSSSSDASTSDESEDPTSAQPSDDEFMSDQHPRRKDYDESDEILPHTGHLSTSVSVSPTSRPVLARSRTDDSDESIDMLASTHGRTA